MNQNINIHDRIEQLLFIADSFLMMSEDLGNFYFAHRDQIVRDFEVLNSSEFMSMVIQQKLFFSEVLLIFKTLFEKSGNPVEISFEQLFKEASELERYKSEYIKIRIQYSKSGLKSSEIR
ncbi:hypothetical protein KC909_04485 [Candidatus Dojkabacteria bacterium]|uniref:Uncharacterized protein n=1 Tax=Candidatus Dojkabacteria bacterium TaxID=2099670 RepID=A0A955L655_9BACT|nr:hypothetical protein [Candidatus Dojkabacteria bacterium]